MIVEWWRWFQLLILAHLRKLFSFSRLTSVQRAFDVSIEMSGDVVDFVGIWYKHVNSENLDTFYDFMGEH